MKVTKQQLRDRFRRWAEDIVKAAQPEAVEVTRVDHDEAELWVDGYRKTVRDEGAFDLKAGDKIYKSKGRSAGAVLGVAYNSTDGTRYPRLRADYLTSPAGQFVISAGIGSLTVTATDVVFDPGTGGATYSMTDIGAATEYGSLIWMEM